MLVFGFKGTYADTSGAIYKALATGKAGGVLLFANNIAPRDARSKLAVLCSTFHSAAAIPPFITIDQEGGRINRLPGSILPASPSALVLGITNDTALTRRHATNTAGTLAGLGINVNFAPVLDVHNASCPVIGRLNRAYAKLPQTIVAHAGQVVAAHRQANVITVVKHFPGHGNSAGDTHKGLADVTKTWKQAELEPYRRMIDSGLVDAVMAAHVVNGKLDAQRLPASLSKQIITGLLRDSLGFNGVVFSDDMLMEAIAGRYKLPEALQLAIDAGVDVLLFGGSTGKYDPVQVHALIRGMVDRGMVTEERIGESYRRIMQLKGRLR